MIQILMYCWNLRKLCVLLDERRTREAFAEMLEDLEVSATLSENLSGEFPGEYASDESD